MTDTVVGNPPEAPPPPPPGKPPMSLGDKIRFVLRGIGQTLITLGLVVLLFVVYEVWITNIFSIRENHKLHAALEQKWEDGDDPLLTLPGDKHSTIPLGTGIANIYMPRLGADYHWTIVEGTSQDDLAKGPGHYVGTALPGKTGNFSVAGHRVGKGEPFLNLDKLRAGDSVVIETKSDWFVYCVIGNKNPADLCNPNAKGGSLNNTDKFGVPGREIVDPSDGNVLLPVPNDEHAPQPYTVKYMTMTTCHPKFTAARRMIVHAILGMTIPKTVQTSTFPAAIQSLYSEVKA